MREQSRVKTPTLLLDFDGYSVETVLVGPWNKYTAWVLLHKDQRGKVKAVGDGWAKQYNVAQRDAYEAYIEHKRLMAPKEEA